MVLPLDCFAPLAMTAYSNQTGSALAASTGHRHSIVGRLTAALPPLP